MILVQKSFVEQNVTTDPPMHKCMERVLKGDAKAEFLHHANLRTYKVQNMVLDDENPWDGILASTIFAQRATVHTITQYTPVQLIFGRDSIIN